MGQLENRLQESHPTPNMVQYQAAHVGVFAGFAVPNWIFVPRVVVSHGAALPLASVHVPVCAL
jgi:hypothetical protein